MEKKAEGQKNARKIRKKESKLTTRTIKKVRGNSLIDSGGVYL